MLLLNLGMPDAPDAASVRRYIAETLADPEATGLPRGLRWLSPALAGVVARLRSARRAEAYRRIWGEDGAPPAATARAQAAALQSTLPEGMPVFCAMRFGRPGVADALREVEAQGINALVAVSMFPQYSRTTTPIMLRELYTQIGRMGCSIDVAVRGTWYDDVGYINAQARRIHEYAVAHGLTPENTHLVYSLRSAPTSRFDRGDPYMDQIHRTVELVGRRLGWPADRTSWGCQRTPGAADRLEPTTSEVLTDLRRAGEKQVLVCPLSFTTDCLETLEAIQIRYRAQFESEGGRFFACPALNTFEPFIAALRNLVLHGRHPVSFCRTDASLIADARARRAEADEAEAPIESLVMVGMSLDGRLGSGRGPVVAHADAEALRRIKKTQCEVPDMLRGVCQDSALREAWLWNTCRRYEFYGWLRNAADDGERAGVIVDVQRQLFNHGGREAPAALNVLHGADAWHHLMRTAAGLNSGLPGERDVLRQLQVAHRLAGRAGVAGPVADRLLAEITQNELDLRRQTEWGRFNPDYAYAAISQIAQSAGLDLPGCRCVVIGGSTTSCGVLHALAERFDVPRRRLTLLHRGHGHGGHLKMLRRAIGNGRRIRVHKYREKSVVGAIAEADVVFIGLDRDEPILDGAQIRACRDFTARPLTIVDFNMFGSTEGIDGADGVSIWSAEEIETAVAAFAEHMCHSEQFADAVVAAEQWICDHLPHAEAAGT